ncbi:two-component system QseEF-associated lipoprotein QseG [Intestinirhabdus alba]|jgi:hypothetical protein|uniref:Two-component system QseEF-associated lipoprotein QseG n=1 Tax=Intestinirhabdus alba TaxID=2899544 RepID=A0A6L6ILA7_9ENTR|nr:two-component system QseEF-associated lipoprotein QseG [Intestinirhabdus alba]MTH45830.1 two-component system QseEF-associated lipoprotein QseG [Intestinirhabdus alba]
MPHVFIRIFQRFFARRLLLAGAPCLALLGCVPHAATHSVTDHAQQRLPSAQLADYLSTECADIWALRGQTTESNPLYWLRAIDCAARLSPGQSRAKARTFDDESWQGAFKRGVLLAEAKITPPERRAFVSRMDALSSQIPAQVRPLYQVWRDVQALQLALAEERQRYGRLQQTSDEELDALRQQQQQLRQQLELTARKLENLTDIERQLSSRKPAGSYAPETPHVADQPALPAEGAQ